MRLLLTGFEPFGTSTVNPSLKVVKALAQRSLAGIELVTAILPVDRSRGPAELLRCYGGRGSPMPRSAWARPEESLISLSNASPSTCWTSPWPTTAGSRPSTSRWWWTDRRPISPHCR